MKKLLKLICTSIVISISAHAQNVENHAPAGYDILRTGIPHGKIDTVIYASKTVGTNRRAIIYTPPDYSKVKSILYSTFCMVSAVTKKNGSKEDSHRLSWIIYMPITKLCR